MQLGFRAACLMMFSFVACTGGTTTPTGGTSTSSSSGSTTSSSSSGGVQTATPQAIVDAKIEESEAKDCPFVGSTFELGTFGDQTALPPVASSPVPDGQALQTGVSAVRCTVKSDVGGRFSVDGFVAGDRRLTVAGLFAPTGEQSNISVTLGGPVAGADDLTQTDCVATYPSTFQGVAAGRVWAEVRCPNAKNTAGKTCNVVAQFRLENCSQK